MHSKRAFTLIELLTVIAIIGILAAMLMADLERSKEKAYQAHCASNLKQLGYAVQMFADEHGDVLPGPLWVGLYPLYNTETERMPFYLTSYLGLPDPSATAHIAPVAICPAAALRDHPAPASTPADSLAVPISYVVTTAVTNNEPNELSHPFGYPYSSPFYRLPKAPDELPKKVSEIMSGSTAWAVTDCDQQNAIATGLYYPYLSTTKVHLTVRNQLFFDWHVAAVQ